MATIATINNEGSFDATVRRQINTNFANLNTASTTNAANIATNSTAITALQTGATHPVSASAPATAGAAGVAGAIAYDSGFLYVCVATNTWLKAAIATW